jgi:hypothetical protein
MTVEKPVLWTWRGQVVNDLEFPKNESDLCQGVSLCSRPTSHFSDLEVSDVRAATCTLCLRNRVISIPYGQLKAGQHAGR